MKNIYFIEAKSPGAHIFSRSPLPRLGSILLGTIFKKKGYNVKVFIEDIAPPDWNLLKDADLVCISSITPTATRAFQLAERFKKAGTPVALGGPHSTFLPEESLHYADYVVRGEGEETLVELVEHLKAGKPLDSIKGLSYKTAKGIVANNPPRELLKDLETAPIPDFTLVYKWEKARVKPIATSRGCPFACKFCSVIPMFGRKYRFKSVDRIIDEIVSANPKKGHLFFIDDNFAANKKRTKDLLRAIIDKKIKFEWSAQVRTDVADDPELLPLMKKAGCFAVYIGFESINPKTLALYNKGQELEDIENSIRQVKKHNINIHGMFVLGSDTDDIETIRNTAKFAKRLDIESIQFMMLTPLPGTPVFEELKSSRRLIHTDWSRYDAHHAVFEPKLMTAFELHIETLKAMSRFYSWTAILRNLWQFDFFYAVVGLYGKRSVRTALAGAKEYLEHIGNRISSEFDKKTNGLRLTLLDAKKIDVEIFCDQSYRDGTDEEKSKKLEFLKIFFKKIKIIPVIVVTPVKAGNKEAEKLILRIRASGFRYEKTTILTPLSDFKLCVDLGLLLGIKRKKLRSAYLKTKKRFDNEIKFGSLQIVAGPQ